MAVYRMVLDATAVTGQQKPQEINRGPQRGALRPHIGAEYHPRAASVSSVASARGGVAAVPESHRRRCLCRGRPIAGGPHRLPRRAAGLGQQALGGGGGGGKAAELIHQACESVVKGEADNTRRQGSADDGWQGQARRRPTPTRALGRCSGSLGGGGEPGHAPVIKTSTVRRFLTRHTLCKWTHMSILDDRCSQAWAHHRAHRAQRQAGRANSGQPDVHVWSRHPQ